MLTGAKTGLHLKDLFKYLTLDRTNIYFKAWGTRRPVVFLQSWPLIADAWDAKKLLLGQLDYRVIALDRRCKAVPLAKRLAIPI